MFTWSQFQWSNASVALSGLAATLVTFTRGSLRSPLAIFARPLRGYCCDADGGSLIRTLDTQL